MTVTFISWNKQQIEIKRTGKPQSSSYMLLGLDIRRPFLGLNILGAFFVSIFDLNILGQVFGLQYSLLGQAIWFQYCGAGRNFPFLGLNILGQFFGSQYSGSGFLGPNILGQVFAKIFTAG